MTLRETERRTWTFDVIDDHHLDAPQEAKSKVADENEDVSYFGLSARVVEKGGPYSNSVVTVVEK